MASTDSSFHLGNTETFKLSPVVVFSILDSYKRRTEGSDRVVGTLLGEKRGQNTFIKECFPVPFKVEESGKALFDLEYHESMLKLHKQCNPDQIVLGWFTTGSEIGYVTSLIQEVYEKEVAKEKLMQGCSPVHLTVDPTLKTSSMPINAYTAKAVAIGNKKSLYCFEAANLIFHGDEAERIGVDALINGHPDSNELDAPATILTDLESLELSLSKLRDNLERVQAHVQKVVDNKIKPEADLGTKLMETLAVVPHLNPKLFNNNVQDMLTIIYLANLTRAQLALSGKITTYLSEAQN